MELSEKAIKILNVLKNSDSLTIDKSLLSREIAEKSFLLPKSTTGTINSLVNKELVAKTNDTPRKYIITPKGIEEIGKK